MSIQVSADRRVAVVTGGSGAIGGAIAARLAHDHTVVVLDRHGDVAVDLGGPDAGTGGSGTRTRPLWPM